jgi:hypothetical protein
MPYGDDLSLPSMLHTPAAGCLEAASPMRCRHLSNTESAGGKACDNGR